LEVEDRKVQEIRKAKEHQELVGRIKELFRQRTEMPSGVTYENTEDCALVKLNRIPPHNPHAEAKERLQGQRHPAQRRRRHRRQNHEAIEVGQKASNQRNGRMRPTARPAKASIGR